MSEHHENFEHHDNQEPTSTHDEQHVEPSAPPASDDNGFIVVPPTPQSSVDSAVDRAVEELSTRQQEEISKLIADVSHNTEASLQQPQHQTVVAEADSSVARDVKEAASDKGHEDKKCSSNACNLCPYYLLACDYLTKVEVPPKVRDLVLWKCPKLTGAVFGTSFVLLLSLASFSLLTVVSSLMLTALSVIGAYRFYLALMFRIKGTYDNTFENFSKFDLSLPKDKVQNLAHLLETDVNKVLNKVKSVLLWDNVTSSVLAYVGFYVVYCVGCCFNTLTLLTLALVSVFTLPKVYQVYKAPIDQGIAKATDCAHSVMKQVLVKIPMLNKKKTQ